MGPFLVAGETFFLNGSAGCVVEKVRRRHFERGARMGEPPELINIGFEFTDFIGQFVSALGLTRQPMIAAFLAFVIVSKGLDWFREMAARRVDEALDREFDLFDTEDWDNEDKREREKRLRKKEYRRYGIEEAGRRAAKRRAKRTGEKIVFDAD